MPKAAGLAVDILKKYGSKITSMTMLPSGGGVYEIILDGELIFSKKALGRFPETEEIEKLIG